MARSGSGFQACVHTLVKPIPPGWFVPLPLCVLCLWPQRARWEPCDESQLSLGLVQRSRGAGNVEQSVFLAHAHTLTHIHTHMHTHSMRVIKKWNLQHLFYIVCHWMWLPWLEHLPNNNIHYNNKILKLTQTRFEILSIIIMPLSCRQIIPLSTTDPVKCSTVTVPVYLFTCAGIVKSPPRPWLIWFAVVIEIHAAAENVAALRRLPLLHSRRLLPGVSLPSPRDKRACFPFYIHSHRLCLELTIAACCDVYSAPSFQQTLPWPTSLILLLSTCSRLHVQRWLCIAPDEARKYWVWQFLRPQDFTFCLSTSSGPSADLLI